MMKRYLEIDTVHAEPMSLYEYESDKVKRGDWTTNDVKDDQEGYKVTTKENHICWMSKETFEKKYREIDESNIPLITILRDKDTVDFPDALRALKNGKKVRRKRWGYHGNNIHLELQVPDEHSKMTLPYIFMYKEVDGEVHRFPCDLSCESLLAKDWEVVG